MPKRLHELQPRDKRRDGDGVREVVLHGIGKLKTVAKPARTGRNPATGEEIEIAAKTAVKFVAAKALKDAVA